MRISGAITAAAIILAAPANAAISFGGVLAVAGDATDLSGLSTTGTDARLSFGSDLTYSARTGTFYGISDRGPGGGTLDFAPRLHNFTLDFTAGGTASNFNLVKTSLFRQPGGAVYSGLRPDLLPGGSSAVLGNSLDTEGLARLPNGQFVVADEYGPAIHVTNADGKVLRSFTIPGNIIPRQADSTINYSDGRSVVQPGGTPITTGRQDNRGFEGLTVNSTGTTAWAILQDPLVNEGASNDGRRSQNLRIIQFDVATGKATGQFVYQLEGISSINGRIPGAADDFSATNQGRSIGVSSITWIGGTTFLVIERDNRGQGPDNLVAGALQPVGTKRVFMIDIAGATDVSGTSLAGSNALPGGVVAVSKTLFIDVQQALVDAGEIVPEKIEGLAIGPRLAGGGFALILGTDNDFSVTQNASGVQFDVCSGGSQIAVGAACPAGEALIPSRIISFAVTGADAAKFDASLFAVPEPETWAMLIAGFSLTGAMMRRRRPVSA